MSALAPAAVQAALETARERGEDAVHVAAYLDGRLVVDAWAGPADGDTLYNVFSVTKIVTATALHVQVARGLLSYDDPVARHWPAFGRHGKDRITVRDVLSHRAGIPWMPEGVTPERQADWAWMVAGIEDLVPETLPGTENCYHALVWGWVVGELVRRVDPAHRPFERFVREEVLDPIGVDDAYLGLPPEHDVRRAVLSGGASPEGAAEDHLRGMPAAVYPGPAVFNTELGLRTVNPSAGLIGNARSVARLLAVLAGRGELDGVRLLPAELVELFPTPRDGVADVDRYLGAPARVGGYGYWTGGPGAHPCVGDRPRVLQHPGAGGSIAWAELDTGLAVAICHNRMHAGPFAPEVHPFVPLAEAVREHVKQLSEQEGGRR
ncbi:beta-lactamase family protein [Pimelobacter simplex]|uniref:Beta-lactamase family protein n=1 Tax=Nocardioides simplex TaxID=2045 RepID=A0A7J5E325_NOCSI|nr:serine hydrolase domain-containing protein [Pimelobacter simplex]KAB2812638.1 beta-lactamase family protein [Pimelobacter simplex]